MSAFLKQLVAGCLEIQSEALAFTQVLGVNIEIHKLRQELVESPNSLKSTDRYQNINKRNRNWVEKK